MVQHLLGAALAAAILLVTWRFFGRPAALVAGTVAAFSPRLIEVEHQILSDFLFTVAVFSGSALLACSVSSRPASLLRLALAGVLFGIATDVKPVGQALALAAPVVLLLTQRARRPVLLGTLAATAGMALVVAPWVVRNEVEHGHATVSIMGGSALFWRVFDGDRLAFVGVDPDTQMARRVYAAVAAEKRPPDKRPPDKVWTINTRLEQRGYTSFEAGRNQRDMAVRAILADPKPFAANTVSSLGMFAKHAGPTYTQVTAELDASFKSSVAGAPGPARCLLGSFSYRMMNLAARLISPVWWATSLFGLAGALLLWSGKPAERAAILAFGVSWSAIATATAVMGLPSVTYSVAGMPMLWIIGSAGAVTVVTAVRKGMTPAAVGVRARP